MRKISLSLLLAVLILSLRDPRIPFRRIKLGTRLRILQWHTTKMPACCTFPYRWKEKKLSSIKRRISGRGGRFQARFRLGKTRTVTSPLSGISEKSKLLLDLNQNLDLTDDSSGFSPLRFSNLYRKELYQVFSDVRFHIKTEAATLPYHASVHLSYNTSESKKQYGHFLYHPVGKEPLYWTV